MASYSTVPIWLRARFALSKHAAQFTLPIDMKTLEGMTPLEYVKKFCKISSKRIIIYQQIFNQHKSNFTEFTLTYQDLQTSIQTMFLNELTTEEVENFSSLFGLTEDMKFDFKTFCGISAYLERLFFRKFSTPETEDYIEFQKDMVECADFSALDRKLNGVKISENLNTILHTL